MLLDYKSKEYNNWLRMLSKPVTYAGLTAIKGDVRKDKRQGPSSFFRGMGVPLFPCSLHYKC